MKNKHLRMLNPRLDSTTVKQNEPANQFDGEKGIRYDINCVLADGTTAQVEMQGYDKKCEYAKRAEYYAARLASSAPHVGDDWNELPRSYQISVLNFIYDKGNFNPLHHYTMADISALPAAIKWGTFLKEADNPIRQDLIDSITESEEGIMNAEVVLAALSDDRWRWIEQGRIDGDRRDIADGLRRSKEEGMNEAKIENARNLLAMKLGTHEQIAKAVGLPIEKIAEISAELAKETTL